MFVSRKLASMEYGRPLTPNWSGTLGLRWVPFRLPARLPHTRSPEGPLWLCCGPARWQGCPHKAELCCCLLSCRATLPR